MHAAEWAQGPSREQLNTVIEALRANRDVSTCLHGLNQFRQSLRGGGGGGGGGKPRTAAPISLSPGGVRFLLAYLDRSPAWEELQGVWDAQLTVGVLLGGGIQQGGRPPPCWAMHPLLPLVPLVPLETCESVALSPSPPPPIPIIFIPPLPIRFVQAVGCSPCALPCKPPLLPLMLAQLGT